MLLGSIPAKFSIVWAANATGGDVRNIPVGSQINIQPGAASLNDGFPPVCFIPPTAGGVPPFGSDFNGILKQLSAWAQWQSAGATVNWDSSFQVSIGGYPVGAILQQVGAPGTFWINTVDGNTSNPDAAGAGWTSWSPSNQNAISLLFTVGDGVTPLQVGTQTWLEVPFACTIQRWTLLADQSGSVDINVWKAPYASYPPTSGNSITGGSDPNLSSAIKAQSTNLSGWTTTVSAGDIVKINVASAAIVTKVVLSLYALKS